MESDERFKHLATDPRFKNLRKKQKKIQIDERFQSMFTDEKFTLKYKQDKRGRRQNKTSGDDLKRYYSLEQKSKSSTKKEEPDAAAGDDDDDNDVDDESEDEVEKNIELEEDGTEDQEDEDEEQDDNEDELDEDDPSEVSSSSDESESEEEESEVEADVAELDPGRIAYDWQPLDHDAEKAEKTSRRLALQNVDWDHLDVRDIYTLINSIRPPKSVKVYVSEFGKERLKEEELHGPKEIVDMPRVDEEEEEYQDLKGKMKALNNKLEPNNYKINEYEDADDELDSKDQEMRERIRKYQLNRMKYYYAVIEFDSIESAELVYKELDGHEYEGSSLELDLRFIPDEIEFSPEDVKAECNKLPDLTNYKAPQFINSALQQTNVKFTWDETDVRRQEKLHRAFTKEELEKDDLAAYLASETDSEEEEEQVYEGDDGVSVVTANSEARANKYKQLLETLDQEAEKKKKVDVDVEWGDFSADEEEFDDGDDDDDAELITKDKDKKKKKKSKSSKKKRKQEDEEGDNGELDLLVLDTKEADVESFKFNPEDDRFKAVYESGLYNIDPSHPNFKPSQAFHMIAEKKREKRQKTRGSHANNK